MMFFFSDSGMRVGVCLCLPPMQILHMMFLQKEHKTNQDSKTRSYALFRCNS